jgi:hypothetical protein
MLVQLISLQVCSPSVHLAQILEGSLNMVLLGMRAHSTDSGAAGVHSSASARFVRFS